MNSFHKTILLIMSITNRMDDPMNFELLYSFNPKIFLLTNGIDTIFFDEEKNIITNFKSFNGFRSKGWEPVRKILNNSSIVFDC